MATEAGGWTKGKSREVVPGGACTKASVQVSRPSRLIKLPRVDLPLPAVSTTATRHSHTHTGPPPITYLPQQSPPHPLPGVCEWFCWLRRQFSNPFSSPSTHSLTKSQTIFILYYAYCWRTWERFGCLFLAGCTEEGCKTGRKLNRLRDLDVQRTGFGIWRFFLSKGSLYRERREELEEFWFCHRSLSDSLEIFFLNFRVSNGRDGWRVWRVCGGLKNQLRGAFNSLDKLRC